MNTRINRRKPIFANRFHRDLFMLISFAAIVPSFMTAVALFYLIFNVTAEQMGFPEAIAYNLIPAAHRVTVILAIILPLFVLVMLIFAYRAMHNLVGPYDRVVRELGEFVEGKKQGHIIIRSSDNFWPLVAKINILLDKINTD